MSTQAKPLVSCIMPTCNRRKFIPNAIRYFQRQDYPNKELLIVDDGTEYLADLIPDIPQIRYLKCQTGKTLGAKRNLCVQNSTGNLIMHWDDDDWMAPHRITYQVEALLRKNVEVCGLNKLLFCNLETANCWLYVYPSKARPWLAGGSLLYTRAFWEEAPFPDIQVASDTPFLLSRKLNSYVALPDHTFYVASIHGNNTSPKRTKNRLWQHLPTDIVKDIIGEDWNHFRYPDQALASIKSYPVKKAEKIPLQPQQFPSHAFKSFEFSGANGVGKKHPQRFKVAILITTCNRPVFLKQVLQDLQKEAKNFELKCFIVDDAILRNGKKNYWQTINALWQQVRESDFDYYIQIPDDVQLTQQFVKRAITAWDAIPDPNKICLNLLLDEGRVGRTNWTNYWPEIIQGKGKRFLKTQWVDMIYMSKKSFFEQLQWHIRPIPQSRWRKNPKLSSGVGQQISHRLHQSGWHLYQTTEKLLEHIGDQSIMNPEARKTEPLTASQLPFIFVGMASIPEREKYLKITLDNIVAHVDRIFLFLNDYPKVPTWLRNYKKVSPFLSSEENTNKGDAGKFYGLDQIKEKDFYYFSMDDDMCYPADYVWKMIRKIEQYDRKCVVGCGGYNMKSVVNNFYADRAGSWHISSVNPQDHPVHILHTALTAWHSSTIDFHYTDCSLANMGDIWLAIAAQKQSVPMILIERPANWVGIQRIPINQTIYGRYRHQCTEQTQVFNTIDAWKRFNLVEKGVTL